MSAFRLVALCLAAAVAAGCVGPPVLPDEAAAGRFQRLLLVPMEARPLSVDAAYAASGPALIVHFLPRYTLGMARAVGVLSSILVLIELSETSQRKSESPPMARPAEAWLPTAALAAEAQRLLAAAGKPTRVAQDVQPMPGVEERGRTVLMENWMTPIRAWYNDDTPSQRYAALAAEGIEAVAEVGISNYEVYAGKLLLQVHVKLIDPATGKVLGRTRAHSFTALPPMDEAFAADAQRFKESVIHAGRPLIAACMKELHLLPK